MIGAGGEDRPPDPGFTKPCTFAVLRRQEKFTNGRD